MNALETIRQAIEALSLFASDESPQGYEAIAALGNLRTLLAEMEKANPVAWMDAENSELIDTESHFAEDIPLYLHPATDAKDAARYRWLRQFIGSEDDPLPDFEPANATGEELDAAIDAAMESRA